MSNEVKKPDNSKLIEAIAEMRKEYNDNTQNRVINEALRSSFYVPAIMEKKNELIADENNHVTFNEQPRARFILINHKTDGAFFPAFTDEEELSKLETEEEFQPLIMSFADIAGLTENTPDVAGFVVNPFHENLPFTQGILASIKETLIKVVEEREKEQKNSQDEK